MGASVERELRALARANSGELLSEKNTHVGADSPVRVRCKQGHLWEAIARRILEGAWCPVCARIRVPYDEIAAAAAKRGGTIVSSPAAYTGTTSRVRVKCARGHEWDVVAKSIRDGRWCRVCAGHAVITFAQFAERVAINGGEVLSEPFADGMMQVSRVRLRCGAGHEWETDARTVWRGHWCGTCGGRERLGLEEFQRVAESRGGKCLTRRFRQVTDSMKFSCAHGHVFVAQAWRVRRGSWCRECVRLEELRQIAAERRGDVLSTRCPTGTHRVSLRCAAGHQWKTSFLIVQQGAWCPQCGEPRRLPATTAQRRAVAAATGRGSRLTDEQRQILRQMIRPTRGASGEPWNAARLKQLVLELFRISYSLSYCYRLMAELQKQPRARG